jgi:hypothetical protein
LLQQILYGVKSVSTGGVTRQVIVMSRLYPGNEMEGGQAEPYRLSYEREAVLQKRCDSQKLSWKVFYIEAEEDSKRTRMR